MAAVVIGCVLFQI